MKNIKLNKKIIGILIFVIIVAIGAVGYFNRSFFNSQDNTILNLQSTPKTSTNTDKTTDTIISTNKNQDTSESIVFAQFKDGNKEIYKTDFKGQNKKTIYTDTDENLKIKKFGGLAYLSKEILVLIGDDPIGKLEVIKADGSGQKSIINESFGNPSSLAISPDGKIIAFSNFSNVEADYGYNVYTISRDGQNRRKITGSVEEISSLSWNKDGSKLAFIKTYKDKRTEIDVANLDSSKVGSIYNSSQQILTLHWNPNNKITFSLATNKLAAGEIWLCSSDGSEMQKLYSSKKDLPVYSNLSSDTLNFNFISVNFGDNFDEYREGQLNSLEISGSSIQKIGNANISLGWLP